VSLVEAVAVLLVTVWLLVLSLVSLVLLREVALLRFRSQPRGVTSGPVPEGLAIGRDIPRRVRELIPETGRGVVYVLLMSAICAPCRDLLPRLSTLKVRDPVVALLAGRAEVAGDLEPRFPEWTRVIRDPAATELADALELRATPFAMELEFGEVTGKAFLHEASDLSNLIHARRSGARRLVRGPEVNIGVS
jgi:hypothetical protein